MSNPTATAANTDSQTAPPRVIHEQDMTSTIGVGGIGYEWQRADPTHVWVSVETKWQSQALTISAGDTILGPDGDTRCVVDGLSVWSITGDEWVVELCVENEHGELIPWDIAEFVVAFLGDEAKDIDDVYELDECRALSDADLEQARWEDTVSMLESLSNGDEVRWDGRTEPLSVISTGLTFSQKVYLEGSRGGQYVIEWDDGVPSIRRGRDGTSLGHPHGFVIV